MKVYYDKIIGFDNTIWIAATDKGLCFVSNEQSELFEWMKKRNASEFIYNQEKLAPYCAQFEQYFARHTTIFDEMALDITGTPFEQQVWNQLLTIPYGETRTYSEVAEAIGKPTAVRAVASAIGKNPLLIYVPCHRVIGKNGKLTGFRNGLPLKRNLLHLESENTF